jgi:hypothetical protein
MKKLLFGLLITWGLCAQAQVYNNEWIRYTQTYYKFKVGKSGVHRINQSLLASAGLDLIPAEQFQLWRNGVQVPLFISNTTGVLSSSDYIEFWGEMNDGKPDNELYRDRAYQLNNKWSLETDTATFFLTVNPNVAENLRLNNASNDVTANTLPPDPYFMYTAGTYFRERLNNGFAVNVGDNLFSSSYDKGEGWAASDIITLGTSVGPQIGKRSFIVPDLQVYNGGPAPKFKISVSGNSVNNRTYKVMINSDSVIRKFFQFFEYSIDSATLLPSTLNSISDTITVSNIAEVGCYPIPVGCQTDRLAVHQFEFTYPRKFNFSGTSNFEFTLPASISGNFLKITNFNSGTQTPVLYDLTNGKRYTADISVSPFIQFAIPPTSSATHYILVSEDASNINTVSELQQKNFINYTSPAFFGDYLIISAKALFTGPSGTNPVDDYRQYRSSVAGGSYNAKVFEIDEIIDQFGFGIKKNPAGLRNFLRYARLNYPITPKHVFIIGHGLNYVEQRVYESAPDVDKLNFVPPYGFPASDVLLTANPGSSAPEIPIGRLSVIDGGEVAGYLKKVKEFELAQKTFSPSIADRAWMKNVVHIIGAGEPGLDAQLTQNMSTYADIIKDTLFGANVETFSKSSSDYVEQLNSSRLENLFTEGISVITYFGHSSASTLEFNLDNPENYNNFKKYPIFFGLGCNAGNFFRYNPVRLLIRDALSEKYVLSPDKGTIAFVASTHFGIVHYLDIWASRAYNHISSKSYGKTIGQIMKATADDVFNFTTQEDFYARCNTEESELHGDPALMINPQPKPDYVIEDPMVKISPGFVSIADSTFRISANFINMGKAVDSNLLVTIKRTFPNNTSAIVYQHTLRGIRYADSIVVDIHIDPNNDKGLNRLTVTIDADSTVDEMYENNNSVTKDLFIYEDEARPVYPYNFSIVNRQNIKLIASTANPFSVNKSYRMEMDTTEFFNSPILVSQTVTTPGGVMEFSPGMSFSDSTVYYWRVAPVAANGVMNWNTASFIYLPNSEPGFNQSHVFQHFKSTMQGMKLDSSSRQWQFGSKFENLFIREGSWVTSTGQEAGLSVAINSTATIRNTCWFQSLVFNVFDPVTFQPWFNNVPAGTPQSAYTGGQYGSATNNCGFVGRQNNFEFRWDSTFSRKRAMDFMKDTIPDGAYVVVRSFMLDPVYWSTYADLVKYPSQWKSEDEAVFGPGNSLYYSFKNLGFSDLDSFNRPRQFVLVYRKNDPSFIPKWVFTQGTYDNVTLSADCEVPDTLGRVISPQFGPAKAWKQLKWDGKPMETTPGDNPRIDIIGVTPAGDVDTVMRNIDLAQKTVDVSSIDAVQYPYLKLRLRNSDQVTNTPYQFKYWRLTYVPVPEGAIAPNKFLSMKDTVEIAEPINFKIGFMNVSDVPFDSVKVKMIVTDRNNVQHVLPVAKHRPIGVNDSINVSHIIDTRDFVGLNYLYVDVNPDNDQPEQYHFNNFAYRPFYVKGDTLNPLMDVTFDNVHILNYDIVSSRPTIVIKLKDEAKWNLLNDQSKMKVTVRKFAKENDPETKKTYDFDNDTLQFVPAQQAPNGDNTATAIFKPLFAKDGKYELTVSGKDMSDNNAGNMEYRVTFEVINKPMISNMLNYPNPFTTSTAFVFTLTGTEVPQNIRIQVLTVTGKVVREITKEELGPLHIGRNITEFKWDGTDQYGQKLANGVYLYRVITNLNGKSLDKYKPKDDPTDAYFNKGYGKMYLMR